MTYESLQHYHLVSLSLGRFDEILNGFGIETLGLCHGLCCQDGALLHPFDDCQPFGVLEQIVHVAKQIQCIGNGKVLLECVNVNGVLSLVSNGNDDSMGC